MVLPKKTLTTLQIYVTATASLIGLSLISNRKEKIMKFRRKNLLTGGVGAI